MTEAHDRIRRSLASYALGAVDEDEAAEIEGHLELCRPCREEVAELADTASSLVEPAEAPPADVWERVSRAIRNPLRKRHPQKQQNDGVG